MKLAFFLWLFNLRIWISVDFYLPDFIFFCDVNIMQERKKEIVQNAWKEQEFAFSNAFGSKMVFYHRRVIISLTFRCIRWCLWKQKKTNFTFFPCIVLIHFPSVHSWNIRLLEFLINTIAFVYCTSCFHCGFIILFVLRLHTSLGDCFV